MKFVTLRSIVQVLVLLCLGGVPSIAAASDTDTLANLLHEFLATADKEEAHQLFWAEDLVYTSSSGLRFGKADILQGFESSDDEADAADEEPAVRYTGEDVDIRIYGNTAVLAFKLVGTPSDGSDALYYFNTGTFLKRDGAWKVVAWQATKIPPAPSAED